MDGGFWFEISLDFVVCVVVGVNFDVCFNMSDMLGPKPNMLGRGLQGSMRQVWGLKKTPFIKWAGSGNGGRLVGWVQI